MADVVRLAGGPLDGKTVRMAGSSLIVPIVRHKADGSVQLAQGSYEVQFNPSKAKNLIAVFRAG